MAEPFLKYPVEQSDVRDRAALVAFRSKLEQWNGWLFEGDNGIWKQIHLMMWGDALFRMVNETRRLASEDKGEYATQAAWLAEIIDQGYFATQFLALRRLTEPPANRPHKQIISLTRLIDDIAASIDLFTRENFVSHDGLRFDPAEAEAAFWKAAPPSGFWSTDYLGPMDFDSSREAHERFNRLSGRGSGLGDRSDRMGLAPLEAMRDRLTNAPFDDAKTIANKQIAHSPDPSSIPVGGIPNLTFDQLWQCQRTIVEVTAFIGMYILQGGNHGVIAIPQVDLFGRWDRPFMPAGADDRLRDLWKSTAEERERWSHENSWAIFDSQFPERV